MQPTEDDIILMYELTLQGDIENVKVLLTNFNYPVVNVIKAYRHTLERSIKLKTNDIVRKSLYDNINKVRENRKKILAQLDITTDMTLLEQGEKMNAVNDILLNYLEPYILDNVDVMYFNLCKINDLHTLESFIEVYSQHINFDYQNKNGKTALHVACKHDNDAIIPILLYYCNPLIQDYIKNNEKKKRNNTPLHYAVENRNVNIVKLLLEYGVNPNVQNYVGLTPLHEVEPGEGGNLEIFELLLKHGANINIKCNHKTMLYKMVGNNDDLGVEYVLKCGGNPYIVSKSGFSGKAAKVYYETPIMYADDLYFDEEKDQIKNIRIINLLHNAMTK